MRHEDWCGYYTWDDGQRTTRYSQGARDAYRAGLTTVDTATRRLKRITSWSDGEIYGHLGFLNDLGMTEEHHYGKEAHLAGFIDLSLTVKAIRLLRRCRVPATKIFVENIIMGLRYISTVQDNPERLAQRLPQLLDECPPAHPSDMWTVMWKETIP